MVRWVECSPMAHETGAHETGVQSQVESYQRLRKWWLIPPCLPLSIYKVRIKGKVEQSRKRSSALHVDVVAIEKGDIGSISIVIANSVLYLCSKNKRNFVLQLNNSFFSILWWSSSSGVLRIVKYKAHMKIYRGNC